MLAHQFDPAPWTYYVPNYIEMGVLMVGFFGWFGMWFVMFVKIMPSVAVAEIKELAPPPLKSDQVAAK